MSDIQWKIIRHTKRQENITHNEEKNQSIETDLKLMQMLELADKSGKTTFKKNGKIYYNCISELQNIM